MSDLYLFTNALRDLVRPRRLVTALLLIALPTLLAAVWRATDRNFQPEAAYNTLAATMIFGFILVILSVVFGTGVIAQELEQKTIVYLLTRPVPRWRIALVKFLAAVLATLVTTGLAAILSAAVTYGPAHLGESRLGRDLLILPIGALAYTALFLLLATVLNRPLIYGLVFAFGWETLVANLTGDFRRLSVMTYLRVLAPHPTPEAETVDVSQLLAQLSPPAAISSPLAWGVLSGVIAVALIAALLLFSTREYAPREDAE
jgi:ABC-2 type transport system permease protein